MFSFVCNLVVLMLGRTEKQELINIHVKCTKTDTALIHLTSRARTIILSTFSVVSVCASYLNKLYAEKLCSLIRETTKGWSKGKIIQQKGKEDRRWWFWDKGQERYKEEGEEEESCQGSGTGRGRRGRTHWTHQEEQIKNSQISETSRLA